MLDRKKFMTLKRTIIFFLNIFMKIKLHLVVEFTLNNIEWEFSIFVNYLKFLVVNGNKSSK